MGGGGVIEDQRRQGLNRVKMKNKRLLSSAFYYDAQSGSNV